MFEDDDQTETERESADWPEADRRDGTVDDGREDGPSGGDGPDVAELEVRLGELEDDLETNESSLRALRSSQEEMVESMEEMNDRVRRLLGVYDRLTAAENPFVDEPGEATAGGDTSEMIWQTDAAPASDGGSEHGETENGHLDGESEGGDGTDDVVSFSDLQERADDRGGHEAGAGPTAESGTTDAQSAGDSAALDERAPVLGSLPDGYAGDVIAMGWLATLMERSGPAGALRAVNYYEDMGWITPAVKRRLVDVIGGPALDVFVDPTRPREPTADEHAVSHEYLRVLDRLTDL